MKYKVTIVEGTGYKGLTSVQFYTRTQAELFCREMSSTPLGASGTANAICNLFDGVSVIKYIDGNPV